jgi:hypothetical protein
VLLLLLLLLLLLQAQVAPFTYCGVPEHTVVLLLLLLQAVGCDHVPLSRQVETENAAVLLLLLEPLLTWHLALQVDAAVALTHDNGHAAACAARTAGKLLHLCILCLTGRACTVTDVHITPTSSNAASCASCAVPWCRRGWGIDSWLLHARICATYAPAHMYANQRNC